ncbi:MAG: hypothetical protein N4A33_01880 [Bacteriovoracaceae bacterium]|jgi:hypothetical protein|nr:hypothetical protein [Bacteriovoracaceae bacterium]
MFRILFLSVISSSILANICICQYPGVDAKYGYGKKKEIPFYKMGCSLWLKKQKCSKKVTKNINIRLDDFLKKNLKDSKLVTLGFVGHWKDSFDTVSFLSDTPLGIVNNFNVSVELQNTACFPLKDPEYIYNRLSSMKFNKDLYIKVSGAQTTSIGMWDTLSKKFKYADLMASVDSRSQIATFPKCETYEAKRCTKHQYRESGTCIKDGEYKEIKCDLISGSSKKKVWRVLN